MGLNESTPKKKLTITHERFTRSQLNPQTKQIDSFIPVNYSQFDYQYWLKNISQIQKDPNSKLLFLPLSYSKLSSSFDCNTNPQLKLSFENHPYLLETQINNRRADHQHNNFDQAEMWLLLYSLVKSQKAFSNLSLKVGDIHPHSIFINEEGYPRLACQFSWPNQKTNFQKMFYDKNLCFLSPEQVQLLEQGQCPDICYSNTSEAFSIGMTLLSAGLLQSLDRYCDMKTFKFNHKYLEYCINRWMTLKFRESEASELSSYSDELKDIVKNLCHLNKHERYLSSKVYDLLQPYQQKIMNMERFELKNYLQIKKALSPHIEYSKTTHHQIFFNNYAALSGNKINSSMQNDSEAHTNTYTKVNISLGTKQYENWKENTALKQTEKQTQNLKPQNIGFFQSSIQKSVSLGEINSRQNNTDLLAKIQQQIKQSQQAYQQYNK